VASKTYQAIALSIAAALLAALVALLTGSPEAVREAAPTVKVQSAMGPNDSIETKNWCDPFPYDAMTLLLTGADNQSHSHPFCTSHGAGATAKVFTDKAGRHFVFLEYHSGHGTNAVTEHLKIFRFGTGQLFDVMQIDLGWYTGVEQHFKYEYTVESAEAGGLLIMLRGEADAGSECCVPQAMNRTIRIDDSD
jgi:hypothetical protein